MSANDGMTVRNTAFDRGRAISLGGASSLGVLLALGGCAVGPTFKPPQATVNESWRASGDPRVSTQTTADSSWWRAFGDSTLDRLVELAYRQNLPLQIAGLRIVEARAQLAVVTGLQFPQTQLATGSATAIGLSKNVVNIPNLPRNFGIYQVGFDAAWELDFWGKYRRGVEAEAATLLGSVADYESALVSLTAEVARTYVVVRTFEVLIAQTEENARVQEQALEIAQSRFRNGATSELDPTQATTLLAEHPGLDPPARRPGSQQARNALSTCSGSRPGRSKRCWQGPRRSRRRPPRSSSASRPRCCAGARTSAAPSCSPPRSAPASASPRPISIRASRSSAASAFKPAPPRRCRTISSPRARWPTPSARRSTGPSSTTAASTNGVRVEDARFQELLVSYRDTVLKAAQEVGGRA